MRAVWQCIHPRFFTQPKFSPRKVFQEILNKFPFFRFHTCTSKTASPQTLCLPDGIRSISAQQFPGRQKSLPSGHVENVHDTGITMSACMPGVSRAVRVGFFTPRAQRPFHDSTSEPVRLTLWEVVLRTCHRMTLSPPTQEWVKCLTACFVLTADCSPCTYL